MKEKFKGRSLFSHPERCALYEALKSNPQNKELKELLEKKYESVITSGLLDKDFCQKFCKEIDSRLLELDVACNLLHAKSSFISASNGSLKKLGGPDFKIKCQNHNIFIECVCAGDSKVKNVPHECDICKPHPLLNSHGEKYATIGTQMGVDKRKTSRLSSVIYDKSKKIQEYMNRGIIASKDIVILVVGANLNEGLCNDFQLEFGDVIGYRSIHEYSPENIVVFKENTNRSFKKGNKYFNDTEEKSNQFDASVLDWFNVFVCASKFFTLGDNKNDALFSYKAYIRKLPNENCKKMIESIFNTDCIEFNRYLYRAGGHPRCTEEAIAKSYQSVHSSS